jgi:murein L,D-transpeptidase YcbB/YkuD
LKNRLVVCIVLASVSPSAATEGRSGLTAPELGIVLPQPAESLAVNREARVPDPLQTPLARSGEGTRSGDAVSERAADPLSTASVEAEGVAPAPASPPNLGLAPIDPAPVVIGPGDLASSETEPREIGPGALLQDGAEAAPQAPLAPAFGAAPAPDAGTTLASAALPAPDALALSAAIARALDAVSPEKRFDRAMIDDLEAFYAANGGMPLWHEGGGRNAAAMRILGTLRLAETHGLDVVAYAAPAPIDQTADAIAAADVALSRAAVLYARDARGARIPNPRSLTAMFDVRLALPMPGEVLAALRSARDAGQALDAFNPAHEGYRALVAELARLRGAAPAPEEIDRIDYGVTMRLGKSDERVPALRRRLKVLDPVDPTHPDYLLFDLDLAEAVKLYQRENGIRATGIVAKITLASLNGEPIGPKPARKLGEREIIANMERWRWLPADLGGAHIAVNVPEFMLRVVQGGVVTHETRTVVGKPETQTPIFSDALDFIVVNPTWTMPASIAMKDYLPRLQRNPYALQGRGYDVIRNGRVVDPGTIDWWAGLPDGVSLRQAPGERNALGAIKFMFPNDHAVYFHDTPKKDLFAEDYRAASHGCVRVEDPFELAEVLLGGPDVGWPADRVRRMVGGSRERTIRLAYKAPVHLMYFTVTTDASGQVVRHGDLYGHDERVLRALKI